MWVHDLWKERYAVVVAALSVASDPPVAGHVNVGC